MNTLVYRICTERAFHIGITCYSLKDEFCYLAFFHNGDLGRGLGIDKLSITDEHEGSSPQLSHSEQVNAISFDALEIWI